MRKYFQQKNKKKGFTLVETLVAISIFTMSVLAVMTVLGGSITSTNYAKQKMIASYLAQEGIEYIRNMRDTYVLYSTDGQTGWNDFNSKLIPSPDTLCASADGCFFNADGLNYADKSKPMTKISFTACSTSDCQNGMLGYDSTTGKYDFSGTASGFKRKIDVTTISSDEIKITSTVFWTQGSGNYNITFSENLFNWVE